MSFCSEAFPKHFYDGKTSQRRCWPCLHERCANAIRLFLSLSVCAIKMGVMPFNERVRSYESKAD